MTFTLDRLFAMYHLLPKKQMYHISDLADFGYPFPLFSQTERIGIIIVSVISSLCLVADSITLFALLSQRNIPHDTFFIISLTTADSLYTIVSLFFSVLNGKSRFLRVLMVTGHASHLAYSGGWAGGKSGIVIIAHETQ